MMMRANIADLAAEHALIDAAIAAARLSEDQEQTILTMWREHGIDAALGQLGVTERAPAPARVPEAAGERASLATYAAQISDITARALAQFEQALSAGRCCARWG
jgi:hypothetical protein